MDHRPGQHRHQTSLEEEEKLHEEILLNHEAHSHQAHQRKEILQSDEERPRHVPREEDAHLETTAQGDQDELEQEGQPRHGGQNHEDEHPHLPPRPDRHDNAPQLPHQDMMNSVNQLMHIILPSKTFRTYIPPLKIIPSRSSSSSVGRALGS